MAQAPLRPCRKPGCSELVRAGTGGYCSRHQRADAKAADEVRGSAAQRGYDARWRKVRRIVLAKHPLCQRCQQAGRTRLATEVHHIRPIREAPGLAYDPVNLMPLCRQCHDEIEPERGWHQNRQP